MGVDVQDTEANIRQRLSVLHDLLSGYRELTYKLVISQTTLLGAIAYFGTTDVFRTVSVRQRLGIALGIAAIAWLFWRWLVRIRQTSDAHVADARLSWSTLG